MQHERNQYYCEWHLQLIKTDTRALLYEEKDHNIVVKDGRAETLKLLLNLSGVPFIALAAGACGTAATVNDTRLNYEHILNGTRKGLYKQSDGITPITSADVVDDTFVDTNGQTYYKKLTCRSQFVGVSDANQGQPFQEYALLSNVTCPGTPTGTSGTMFNHYVATSAIILNSDVTLLVDTTIRV